MNEIPMNRAQRRAEAKKQKKQMKKIQEYLKRHPEAIKVELDEDKIKEAGLTDKDVITVGGTSIGEANVEIGNALDK